MINRAPFDKLTLDFDNENIVVLSGVNGAGKTTILSYIVDSFYELAKKAFPNEFEGKSNKFYRVSSAMYSIDMSKASIVYLRFSKDNGNDIDYIDIRGKCSEQEYKTMLDIESPIAYSTIKRELERELYTKHWSISDKKEIEQVFNSHILTYFPAYRYETPSFLNDPYKVELRFKTNMDFSGYLPNSIEVTSDLPQIANWIMDIVLDLRLNENSTISVFNQLSLLLSYILIFKLGYAVRFGIGKRNEGAIRLSIVNAENGIIIYPSIFAMSSGELALLCLFGELIKQSDKIGHLIDNVSGVVLVDEIDKHLHIKLQKDILPLLIKVFPNIQFIVSSHSPFLSLGLDDNKDLSYTIMDLDNGGITCFPQDNEPFREAYETMIHQNDQFATKCRELEEQIHKATKPFIITEGKSDWKHLKAAMRALDISDLDVEFYEFEDTLGDTELLHLLKDYSRIPQNRKIIGIFDRDNFSNLRRKEQEVHIDLETQPYVDLGNNVYAFSIPVVHEDVYGTYTSIEHYYEEESLRKTSNDGRRLFLGKEFLESGFSNDNKHQYHTKCKEIKNKVDKNGVIDQKVYFIANDPNEEHSIALSKDDFAQMILDEDEFAKGFDFSYFQKIFDIIREICSKSNIENNKSE